MAISAKGLAVPVLLKEEVLLPAGSGVGVTRDRGRWGDAGQRVPTSRGKVDNYGNRLHDSEH